MIETAEAKKKRLHWQCRRGMLEIDLILNRYLSACYLEASLNEQAIFEQILSENDQHLFLWLTEKESPPEKYVNLVLKLRQNSSKSSA